MHRERYMRDSSGLGSHRRILGWAKRRKRVHVQTTWVGYHRTYHWKEKRAIEKDKTIKSKTYGCLYVVVGP